VKRTLGDEGGVKNGRVFFVVGLREQKHGMWRYGKQMDLVVDIFVFLYMVQTYAHVILYMI
jgi:hypothetical protein